MLLTIKMYYFNNIKCNKTIFIVNMPTSVDDGSAFDHNFKTNLKINKI